MANIIDVSALNRYAKSLLDGDEHLADIAVRGEISNFKRHDKTGHCYFTLKDEHASVRAVMFRAAAQGTSFRPADGMAVLARGRVTLYEKDGSFQLYAEHLFPDGLGSVQLALAQLQEKLKAEGLFAAEHKKPLPRFPKKIGLVTSKTGAALQDILKVAQARCPTAQFILAPVTVQGLAAAEEIAAAIRAMDSAGADVVIVARGGGSAEDLWVFNDEQVARAAFGCRLPLVSAIGHETDVTILDFVADFRAPTPSAAAELVLPDLPLLYRTGILNIYANIRANIHAKLELWYNRLCDYPAAAPLQNVRHMPQTQKALLAEKTGQIDKAALQALTAAQSRLGAAALLADSLSPYKVLGRGYALAEAGDEIIKSVRQTQKGQDIGLRLADGSLACRVTGVHPAPPQENENNAQNK